VSDTTRAQKRGLGLERSHDMRPRKRFQQLVTEFCARAETSVQFYQQASKVPPTVDEGGGQVRARTVEGFR